MASHLTPPPKALQAPLVLHWLYWLEPLLHPRPALARGSVAQTLQGKPARLGWGLFSWKSWPDLLCAHPCCPALQAQTDHCQPEPTPQPVWAGNRAPPSSREADPCLSSKSLLLLWLKAPPALRPGHEAEQLPGPTAAGLCLPWLPRADGDEASKETAFLLKRKKKKKSNYAEKEKPTLFSPHCPALWHGWVALVEGGTVWMVALPGSADPVPPEQAPTLPAPTLAAPSAPGDGRALNTV